jgi:hypothetical protein
LCIVELAAIDDESARLLLDGPGPIDDSAALIALVAALEPEAALVPLVALEAAEAALVAALVADETAALIALVGDSCGVPGDDDALIVALESEAALRADAMEPSLIALVAAPPLPQKGAPSPPS